MSSIWQQLVQRFSRNDPARDRRPSAEDTVVRQHELLADPRLTVAAKITWSEPGGSLEIEFVNTSADAIGLWEFGLLIGGKIQVWGLAIEEVIPPGETYTWSEPLWLLLRVLRIDGGTGVDGAMVAAYTEIPELHHFPDLYLPLRDGPLRFPDSIRPAAPAVCGDSAPM